MKTNKLYDSSYIEWLNKLKAKIQNTQLKAIVSVNKEMILLYWEFGKELYEKQQNTNWGSAVVDSIEKDLKKEFPTLKGFSKRNLFYMKQFYTFYKADFELVQQLVALIPWGHNIRIISKATNLDEAKFYINETIENNWSRAVLDFQIKSGLYHRKGKAITNFSTALPQPNSDLANQSLKDPYLFDFLNLKKDADERNIEEQLTKHITSFLLELGTGFAFIGKQYHIEVEKKDYYIDLLFYHLKLKCYVVIELKANSFKPEYAGKLNFYLSAIDDLLKTKEENPTIGLILCQSKNKIEAEYALRGLSQPIGISEYQLSKIVPESIKSELPSIEEIELVVSKPRKNSNNKNLDI